MVEHLKKYSILYFLLFLLVAIPFVARAHEWYPVECCNDQDCYQASADEFEQLPNGVLVKATGELIPWEHVKPSPDGNMHRCSYGGSRTAMTVQRLTDDEKRYEYCIWMPFGMM